MRQEEIIDFLKKNKGKAISYKEVCESTNQNKQSILTAFVRLRKWAMKANRCPIKTVPGIMYVNTRDAYGNQTKRLMRVIRLRYDDTE